MLCRACDQFEAGLGASGGLVPGREEVVGAVLGTAPLTALLLTSMIEWLVLDQVCDGGHAALSLHRGVVSTAGRVDRTGRGLLAQAPLRSRGCAIGQSPAHSVDGSVRRHPKGPPAQRVRPSERDPARFLDHRRSGTPNSHPCRSVCVRGRPVDGPAPNHRGGPPSCPPVHRGLLRWLAPGGECWAPAGVDLLVAGR
jgi:hypothetical protein